VLRTSGSNGYSATTGYDLATGWGSPNGANLINALSGPVAAGFSLSASPSSVSAAQGNSASTQITMATTGSFSSSVALSTSTLPTGVTLQYAERGSASGVPVFLLHGVTDSWRSFEHVLPYLPSTIRAIAVTLRGHGDSSRPEGGYRYAEMAGDVRALMDALGIPAAVVVGHPPAQHVVAHRTTTGSMKPQQ